MDLAELLEWTQSELSGISEDPKKEITNVLVDYYFFDRLDFTLNLDKEVDEKTFSEINKIVKRRKKHEPLPYILENAHFYGLDFYVNNNVLIPRHDTERSVDLLLNILENGNKMLELGIGSGCVSIVCAVNKEKVLFHGVDISLDALEVANINKMKHKLSNVNFWESDMFSNVLEKYDVIYSNPPYIERDTINELDISVKDFEPKLALDGGQDGLDFYRIIASQAEKYMNVGSNLVLEIGYNQADEVKKILEENNFDDINLILDYGHQPRVIWAKKGEKNV